ncbi:MCP four helix bundle domain-containing protein [Herbaspirillum sp. LeCh32-8]|uniref:methyl-accepting chemotaxis protein n=1 Tax=Herbaspirillum sp. LeCh32-8 TaxID=2821356 RepID=UPI001AE85F2D|nr:methyl-accepting chemotaxis protein [Herbaspirillum sp. LeCh32-8]MBP0598002.1 MCP four helix bundle domain-containing protein [Herbaspirillum sp. LeCh32-8]
MNWFRNLKIAKKLLLAFLTVLALTAILGIFSISRLAKLNSASSEITGDWMPAQKTLGDIKLLYVRLRGTESQLAIYEGDLDAMNGLIGRSQAILTGLDKTMKEYEASIDTDQEREIYPLVRKQMAEFLVEHGKIVAAFLAKNNAEGRDLFLGQSNKLYPQILGNLDKLIKVNQDGGEAATKGADDTFAQGRLWVIGMLVAALAIGTGLALYVARIISEPLKDAVSLAQRVAQGDLTADIRAQSRDETGQLMSALKTMNEGLLNVVGNVRAGTDRITTASTEIASGNLDLSSRTEQQAGSLEETASALEELTSTVKQNSDNARQANQLARTASTIAVQGGDVVGQVVTTMASINDASNRIVEIISVIDGIAFQTNILALNAAVEAARAGEQGRGFAVVASEVRSLAQRSASAAKEIKVLIDDSVTKVGAGTTLVQQAGSTMSEVVDSVKRVTDIVAEISAASNEQSTGIEEINRAVAQMDQVTQQNAALVEEAAAAAQSMQEQAGELSSLVSVFKLRAGA